MDKFVTLVLFLEKMSWWSGGSAALFYEKKRDGKVV